MKLEEYCNEMRRILQWNEKNITMKIEEHLQWNWDNFAMKLKEYCNEIRRMLQWN